jgi:ribonucleotide reductase beta subunit family protein with ferritin-like domain
MRGPVKVKMALDPNPDRFVLFPIMYPQLWDFYKRAEASFWTAEELDFENDKRDWKKLSDGQKLFIETVLAFFAASDGIVNENLGANFFAEIQIPEARCFYGFQIAIENIHAETYSLLIETLVESNTRKAELFQGIRTFASIRQKAEWALKWTDRTQASFGERLVAFACVEGIAFSASFCAIFYLKKQGLMCHGLGKSNELISRDEGLHRDFACAIFKILPPHQRPSNAKVHEIVRGCVDVEKMFVKEALPVSLIGMNSSQMEAYVEFVADSLCVALGVEKLYMAANPFEWMDQLSLQGKTNFFEARVSEYAKAGVGEKNNHVFSLIEDF